MINSMTGYGRYQQNIDGRDILVEIKSVNHRYFEFSSRTPRAYGYLDEKLKSLVSDKVSRGKVDVNVSVYTTEGKDAQVQINKALASGYVEALRSIKDELSLLDNLSLSSISRFSDIFTVVKVTEDEELIWQEVKQVAEVALESFVSMRKTEGEKLALDISNKIDNVETLVAKVEELAPKTVSDYKQKLFTKLKEVLENKNIEEARVLTEVALFAEKIAVDEETVRLRSHINQFREMLKSSEPIGRKLDFLVQEINREVNTIGSKCQDVDITKIVVDLKSEIEKIREQIQNIE